MTSGIYHHACGVVHARASEGIARAMKNICKQREGQQKKDSLVIHSNLTIFHREKILEFGEAHSVPYHQTHEKEREKR
jgi:hypothetical protein